VKWPDSDRHKGNRAGSGGGILRRGGVALNRYKQPIFPHERAIKNALVCCGIGAMNGILNNKQKKIAKKG
jgi:hypothetical protein